MVVAGPSGGQPGVHASTSGAGWAGEVVLPTTLVQAIGSEVRRTIHPPFETLIVVAVNGALMSSAWFFLPGPVRDELFKWHGSLAFSLVLATWMYSDVPATNVLGGDAIRALAALDDPAMLRRLLYAKNIVLWALISPFCSLVALLIGLHVHDLLATFFTVVWIGVVPFATLGISNLVGVRFPYHPMPIRYRWEHRRPWWRMIGRWLALTVTPYGVVPALAAVLMAPSLLLWGVLTTHGLSETLPDRDLGWGVAVACLVSLGGWLGSQRIGTRITARRRRQLAAFLSDPTLG
ncbi:MAG: hypothetical protein ACLQRH_28995 [Acidimicrobiales bacterium]